MAATLRTLTNRLGMPDPIVRACQNDDYDRGPKTWRSVTQLTAPPRIAVLLDRFPEHRDVEDVSQFATRLMGTAVHSILEKADKGGLCEQRMYLNMGGLIISGKPDHMSMSGDGLLTDYKTVKIWALSIPRLFAENMREWTHQLNLYALLFRETATTEVKALQVAIPLINGWNKREALRNPEYPQAEMAKYPVPLWSPEKQLDYLNERIRLHEAAERELPLCTDEERWQEPAKYAVKKNGRKSAVRVLDHMDEALTLASSLRGYVEERPSVPKRCMDYCPMRTFCKTLNDGQWASTSEMEEEDEIRS